MTEWSLGGYKEEMRSWLERAENRSFVHDDSRNLLESVVLSGDKEPLSIGQVLTSLGLLAHWHGTSGAVKILEGDASGWGSLQEATVLKVWRLQIFRDLFRSDPRKKKGFVSAQETALCLAQVLTLGDDALAAWCGERLLEGRTDGSIRSWDETPLAPFMVELFRLWRGDSPGFKEPAPYTGILLSIVKRSDPEFASSLLAACDYHLSRSGDDGDEETNEFFDYPYPIFPVEILSILRVARSLGWDVSLPQHPLLQSPLCALPTLPPLQPVDLHRKLAAWWEASPPIG